MVLSNKKLKQKLRAVSAESLSTSMAVTHQPNNESTNPDPNSKTQSLKSLLDSATQKPRLSKREKRRKKGSEVVDGSGSNGDAGNDNREGGAEGVNDEKKKRRKRKRDVDGDEGLQSGVSESAAEIVTAKKAKKSKKKKKKKKKKKENKEENNGVEHGSGEQSVTEDKGVKISDSQENGAVATKVYIGGIPYYSTEDDIRSYFEGCGTITEVDCMKFPESGKFRGIAIISFKTEAAAKRALALDGADMGGLFLKIQPYTTTRAKKESDFAPEIVDGYNRIYVGNLSWDITEEELRKLFSDCSISSIRFGEDKETKEFRGYAHVDFSDSLSLAMALKLDQRIVCGRPVRIRCAVPKKVVETNSRSVPTSKKADNGGMSPPPVVETNSRSVPTSEKADNGGMSSGNGKIKRRTCYECGEKGHISSACPKKQAGDPMNSSAS